MKTGEDKYDKLIMNRRDGEQSSATINKDRNFPPLLFHRFRFKSTTDFT